MIMVIQQEKKPTQTYYVIDYSLYAKYIYIIYIYINKYRYIYYYNDYIYYYDYYATRIRV